MAANDINNVTEVIQDLHIDEEKHTKFFHAVMDVIGDRLSENYGKGTKIKIRLEHLENNECELCDLCSEKHPVSDEVDAEMKVLRKNISIIDEKKKLINDNRWGVVDIFEEIYPSDDDDDDKDIDRYQTPDEEEE